MKIVVLDSNIWLSELALMTPLGCAFSHYIVVSDIKIGLTEIIEVETKYNLRKHLIDYRENIRKNYNRMLAIFGQMKEIVMPEDETIDKKIEDIFNFHKDRLIRIPFDLEGAKSSFDKIIKNLPPNSDSNQQFKDGVIWANCLKLAEAADVNLVTKDKAFYKDRQYSQGLAHNLLKEVKEAPHQIIIFSELASLVDKVKSDLGLDKQKLIELIEQYTYSKVLDISNRKDFEVIGIASSNFEFYATVNPLEVSVKSSIKYNLEGKPFNNGTDGIVESKAEFILSIRNYDVRNFINLGEYISWIDEDGALKQSSNSYAYANIVLGHKTIEHQVSYKIE
ncbi:MAG: PIN domain-containing protein [Candidatus Contendobacter sp.]|nr:PIN domain-containing protein [Candidatus Contendobacter sp.]